MQQNPPSVILFKVSNKKNRRGDSKVNFIAVKMSRLMDTRHLMMHR